MLHNMFFREYQKIILILSLWSKAYEDFQFRKSKTGHGKGLVGDRGLRRQD